MIKQVGFAEGQRRSLSCRFASALPQLLSWACTQGQWGRRRVTYKEYGVHSCSPSLIQRRSPLKEMSAKCQHPLKRGICGQELVGGKCPTKYESHNVSNKKLSKATTRLPGVAAQETITVVSQVQHSCVCACTLILDKGQDSATGVAASSTADSGQDVSQVGA